MKIEKQYRVLLDGSERATLNQFKTNFKFADQIFIDSIIVGGYFTYNLLKYLESLLEKQYPMQSNITQILNQLYKITENEKA